MDVFNGYDILKADSLDKMRELVISYMKDGYVLHGNLFQNQAGLYVQAVIQGENV